MHSLARLTVPLLALAAGVAAVSLHLGCSGSKPPEGPTAVRGRVSFQGRPVEGAMIVFAPDRERGGSGKPLRSETGTDGLFELPGPIPPGWYRVAIAPPPEASATLAHFPPQLRRPDASTLLREVESGKDHVFEFAIEVPARGVN
jgi:hypothetical protein